MLRQFVHGQTYQGHPTACAGALEVQRIIDQDNLLNNVKTMGQYLETTLKATFGNHPNVGDIRGRGLFWAVSSCFPYHRIVGYNLQCTDHTSSLSLSRIRHQRSLSIQLKT